MLRLSLYPQHLARDLTRVSPQEWLSILPEWAHFTDVCQTPSICQAQR